MQPVKKYSVPTPPNFPKVLVWEAFGGESGLTWNDSRKVGG